MRDVARKAGVSVMTVSRALNDPERVSEKMRRRVRSAVEESGYVHNRLARSLSSRRSDVIGLIVPSLRNSLFAETMQGISDVLAGEGFQLMIADSGHSLADEERLIASFLAQRVAGLVLHNTSHTRHAAEMIRKAGIPVVENGDLTDEPLDSVVSYSNFEASRRMTMHLARLGYRTIGFVSLAAQDNERAGARRHGFLAAMEALSRPVDPRLILEQPSGLAAGADAVVRLVTGVPEVDAVFFAGDVLAVGALFECRRRGWAVPARLGIASFDDLDLLRHVDPAVTTVRLPRYEIGRRSAQCLLDRIGGRSANSIAVDLGFDIVQREST
jgi:LacI family gluconate utilization system Gnt-I transcriptional repressor